MMGFLYNTVIRGYYFLVWVVSVRNLKARKWIAGRKNLFAELKQCLPPGEPRLWFHVSSLGEFEQARPVLESVRKQVPQYKIILTFFSPSGYELKKDYPSADYVYYIPLDTPGNVNRFLDIVQPEKVFFVKYEFWFNFLTELKRREIPTYIFSALFRPSQMFFKPWGGWFRKALKSYTHIFVQNRSSFEILQLHGINNVSISGDTRLDRVVEIARSSSRLPKVERFCTTPLVIVAGSTWPEDEALFIRFVNECKDKVKFIIAPHEVHAESLARIGTALKKPFVFYSDESTPEALEKADVLIVDGYGYLVSVYRYARIAYIGGGFTTGIHSILEPAVYGMPVVFGPQYQKFHEAIEMISLGAAHSIQNYDELSVLFDSYLADPSRLENESRFASQYVETNCGATAQIVRYFFEK